MPVSLNPFAASPSPPRQESLGSPSPTPLERQAARRASISKANLKLQSLFSMPQKRFASDAAALQAANAAVHPPTLSLPSISLSTAVGEKSKFEGGVGGGAAGSATTTLFSPPSPAELLKISKQHAQFGPLGSQQHKYSSRFAADDFPDPIEDEPPLYYLLTTYISYLILIIFGHVRDFFGKRFRPKRYTHLMQQDGYAALNSDFDNFYVRRLKMRINDLFARPTTGVPGRYITLVDRVSHDGNNTFSLTGTTTDTLNLSSYNYLGFAQSEGPCADAAEATVRRYGLSVTSPRADAGTTDLHLDAEDLIAKFVGKPAAIVFSMGYGTNAAAFPAIAGKGCLIISDELNHASIRTGMRLSGAVVQTFKHNDMADLERLLREVISQGQPRTHRPWKKILVTVEGLYSMEGTICNLPGLVRLRRRYKFYLYIDEAHSIGALGPRGRGVCDYFGIDTSNVDVLMGTLTKSFGANGGYLAGDRAFVDKLRSTNAGVLYGESPAPPVITQIVSSLRIITGELQPGQGDERLQRLAFNSRYLRLGLKRLGFIISGHDDSPIIPLMLYHPAKISAFSHEMLKRKISVVVVGYPATPLVSSRARFCVSAAHTKDDLDRLMEACSEVGEALDLKLSSGVAGGQLPLVDGLVNQEKQAIRKGKSSALPYAPPRWKLRDVIARGVEDVRAPLR